MGMDPYIGTIRAAAFNFEEDGWFNCDGRLLPINQYQPLFAVIGTLYGGDGVNNFALPDFRSRAVAGRNPFGANVSPNGIQIDLGQTTGSEFVTLLQTNLPMHSHTLSRRARSDGQGKTSNITPTTSLGSVLGIKADGTGVAIPSSDNEAPPNPPLVLDTQFAQAAVSSSGGGMPHENRQPFVALFFQIAHTGLFPTQN